MHAIFANLTVRQAEEYLASHMDCIARQREKLIKDEDKVIEIYRRILQEIHKGDSDVE